MLRCRYAERLPLTAMPYAAIRVITIALLMIAYAADDATRHDYAAADATPPLLPQRYMMLPPCRLFDAARRRRCCHYALLRHDAAEA